MSERKPAANKKTTLRFLLALIFFAFLLQNANSYETIKIVALDKGLWKEISIPPTWTYTDCQSSYVEYPDFTDPTIHYVLHFTDENAHKIELRFNRFRGRLDKNAFMFDMTSFSEKYIRIKK
ncbi:MAG: hypothetical protein K6B43_13395 [Treponema sp.]|nr:hypothetical protein [Treponema sp.]